MIVPALKSMPLGGQLACVSYCKLTKFGRYIHFRHGVTPKFEVYPNQIPPGTSIMLATRYPPGEWRTRWNKAGHEQAILSYHYSIGIVLGPIHRDGLKQLHWALK